MLVSVTSHHRIKFDRPCLLKPSIEQVRLDLCQIKTLDQSLQRGKFFTNYADMAIVPHYLL